MPIENRIGKGTENANFGNVVRMTFKDGDVLTFKQETNRNQPVKLFYFSRWIAVARYGPDTNKSSGLPDGIVSLLFV